MSTGRESSVLSCGQSEQPVNDVHFARSVRKCSREKLGRWREKTKTMFLTVFVFSDTYYWHTSPLIFVESLIYFITVFAVSTKNCRDEDLSK